MGYDGADITVNSKLHRDVTHTSHFGRSYLWICHSTAYHCITTHHTHTHTHTHTRTHAHTHTRTHAHTHVLVLTQSFCYPQSQWQASFTFLYNLQCTLHKGHSSVSDIYLTSWIQLLFMTHHPQWFIKAARFPKWIVSPGSQCHTFCYHHPYQFLDSFLYSRKVQAFWNKMLPRKNKHETKFNSWRLFNTRTFAKEGYSYAASTTCFFLNILKSSIKNHYR